MSCGSVDNLIDSGEGEGTRGASLLRSLKSTHRRQDLSFFGTITKFASQSGCLISLMNPASSSLASSSPIACRLGFENRLRVCLIGLYPFSMLRLCSANPRGMPGMSDGCQAKMSQFSRKKSHSVASVAGLNCVPMEAVFMGSVGWTWNLTISSAGLNEVDLGHLSSITSSLSTVERSVVNSSAARASDNASRASVAVLFSSASATSESLLE